MRTIHTEISDGCISHNGEFQIRGAPKIIDNQGHFHTYGTDHDSNLTLEALCG